MEKDRKIFLVQFRPLEIDLTLLYKMIKSRFLLKGTVFDKPGVSLWIENFRCISFHFTFLWHRTVIRASPSADIWNYCSDYSTLHLKIKKMSTNSLRNFNNVLDTINHYELTQINIFALTLPPWAPPHSWYVLYGIWKKDKAHF